MMTAVQQGSSQAFTVKVRNHQVTFDMAAEEGGDDLGPRPTEMLVMALGACLGKAIARYCKTIEFEGGGISIYLTHEFADNPKRIGSIAIDVELPEGFPENRVKAVERIVAVGCPVHNTLGSKPEVDVEISIGA